MVVTAPHDVTDELDILHALFVHGLQFLHVRKPEWSSRKLCQYLQAIPDFFRNRVCLHSHHDLAVKMRLGGIHLTESICQSFETVPLLEESVGNWKSQGFRVSRSVHTMETLVSSDAAFDYVLAAPVFESISKVGHRPSFQWDIHSIKVGLTTNVIGLGGISADNIGMLSARGFDGAALLGHLWGTPALAVKRFKVIREICKNPDLMY